MLVPVLGRPHRVEPLLSSVRSATPEPHTVLFIADAGDQREIEALEAAGADRLIVPPGLNYARKINIGFKATSEPFIFTAADDLDFHGDWFSRALSYMSEEVHVVGTNDLCNHRTMVGEHSTHTLVHRSYIEEQGTIDEAGKVLHEGYPHEYCDDEFVGTAKARGVYAHAFDSLVEHLHPLVNKAPDDTTYQEGRSRTPQARRLFMERKGLWAPMESEWAS